MALVFIDTSAFLAIKNSRDTYHKEAITTKNVLLSRGEPLITSDYVLDESYTIIRFRAGHRIAIEFGEEVRQSRLIEVIPVGPKFIEDAWSFFKKHKDKDYSFTDCTSFVIMKQMKIHRAFTFDPHFSHAGFDIVGPRT